MTEPHPDQFSRDPWTVASYVADPQGQPWSPVGAAPVLPAAARRARPWTPVWLTVVGIATAFAVAAAAFVVAGRLPGDASVLPAPADRSGPATAATLPPEPPGPAAGQLVVTPQMADQVVRRFWPAHSQALVDQDLAMLRLLSGGAARAWEIEAIRCGCMRVTNRRPLLDAVFFVPRQTRYPARFIAEVRTQHSTGQEGVEVLTFSREGPRRPWLVVETSFYAPLRGGPARLGSPDVDEDGFTRPVGRALRARARTVADELAAAWQEAKETGDVQSAARRFHLVGQTAARFRNLASHPQDTPQRNGLLGHFTFRTAKADPLVVVPESNGGALACKPVHATIVYTGQPGQMARQDDLRLNWGPDVEPGLYRGMVTKQVWQTCFRFGPDPAMPVLVLNHDVGAGRNTPLT